MAVWLVTGGSGFLGRHVLASLTSAERAGVEVVALGRRCPPGWPADRFFQADLDDVRGLKRALAASRPSVVFHTAGTTPPADPGQLYLGNTRATSHLFEALRLLESSVRIVLVGSAAELGPVPPDALPVAEEQPCRPVGAYGLSKWAATRLGLSAPEPLEVVAARVFNPIGPGLPVVQAFGRFAAVLAEPGPDPLRMTVGGLDARRDFIDVRDVASALIALALRGRAGLVYHVGSGHSRSIGAGLELLIHLSGRNVQVEIVENHRGPSDSRAEIRRIQEHTGWAPRISFEQSLADLWDEVHAKVTNWPGSLRVA